MAKPDANHGRSATDLITQRIAELGDWRGTTLARMRALIRATDPDVVEEWKWMGTPVWSHDGIICTGESYKAVVKLTFAHGASLPDPAHLFNASLDGNTRRAIDLRAGDRIDEAAFSALIRHAIERNRIAHTGKKARGALRTTASSAKPAMKAAVARAKQPAKKAASPQAKPATAKKAAQKTAAKKSAAKKTAS